MIEYNELPKKQLINRIKELEEKNKNLVTSKQLDFVEFQQILGCIFKEMHKCGITCKNCKYCYKILKNEFNQEEDCCIFYKKFFNLDVEPIENLCEHFTAKEKKKCI